MKPLLTILSVIFLSSSASAISDSAFAKLLENRSFDVFTSKTQYIISVDHNQRLILFHPEIGHCTGQLAVMDSDRPQEKAIYDYSGLYCKKTNETLVMQLNLSTSPFPKSTGELSIRERGYWFENFSKVHIRAR